jgi:hypothetical protein
MNPETALQNAIRKALSEAGVTNFRNNTGALKDDRGRLVRYGLCKGSSDIIAIKPVTITEDMVGSVIGQFVAVEVKTAGKKATKDQQRFIDAILRLGGLAGVAHSEEEALEMVGPHMLDTSGSPAGG